MIGLARDTVELQGAVSPSPIFRADDRIVADREILKTRVISFAAGESRGNKEPYREHRLKMDRLKNNLQHRRKSSLHTEAGLARARRVEIAKKLARCAAGQLG